MVSHGSRCQDIVRVIRLLRAEADRQTTISCVAIVGIVVFSGALAALAPLMLKSLVDAVGGPHRQMNTAPLQSVGLAAALYLLLLMAGRALSDIRPLLGGTINQRLHGTLTRRFFAHVSRMPMAYLMKRRSSELLHIRDMAVAGAQMVVTHLATSLIPIVVEIAAMVVVLTHLGQPVLVGIFGAAALAYLIVFSLGSRRLMTAADEVSATSLEAYAQLGDAVGNLETLRYFAAEQQMNRRLSDANAALEKRWIGFNRMNTLIAAEATMICTLSMAACLYFGAMAVSHHALTVGGFVLITVYMLQMVQPLEALGAAARDLARALGYMKPFLDLLSEPVSPDNASVASTSTHAAAAIRVENLHFSYEPGRPVLNGVDFIVPAGSTTAIVGRSGSGKSSLARLLMRLHAPQQGCILINERAIDSIGSRELRATLIGFVPQETSLLHDTIGANIALGMPKASRHDIASAAAAAQLGDLLDGLPEGLDTPVGEHGMHLSGGERQRVGIARALLRRPSAYLLDEPTSALDSKTEIDVLAALRALDGVATRVVIAHRLSTIVEADQILVLHEGRICERGCHEALIAENKLYAEMWRQQLAGCP